MIAPTDVRQALESAGLVSGLPVEEVRARLRTGLRLADTGQRVLAFYLNEMEVGRLYQASGHGSTAHYAEVRLDLDRRRTSELIAIGKKLLELPAIDHAFCSQRIGWVKVLSLVTVASPEHEAAWLERAEKLSSRELALEVKLSRPGGPPRKPGERKGLPEIRFPVHAKVGTLTFQKIDLAKKKLSEESGRPVNDAELFDTLAELFLQTEEDGTVPGKTRVDSSLYRIVLRPDGDGLAADTDLGSIPVSNAEALRCDAQIVRAEGSAKEGASGGSDDLDPPTPDWLRRRILARDGHRCRSCRSRRCLMAHHVVFRSHRGATQAKNLVTLCARCHGLVHDGLLVLVGNAGNLRFQDRNGTAIDDPHVAVRDLALVGPKAPADSQTAIQSCPSARTNDAATTLETIPAEIDVAWWRRHSHLLRATPRGLEFEAGVPTEPSPEAAATMPLADVSLAEEERAFDGLHGQDPLVKFLRTQARGSRKLGRSFPHTLLTGPPGTGKTTIARGIAAACGGRCLETSGPLLREPHAIVDLLGDLREGDVVFVDEVHAVPRLVLEMFYGAMTDVGVSLWLRAPAGGVRMRQVHLRLPRFTLVAATSEDVPPPFQSRFGIREYIGFYDKEVLAVLVGRAAAARGFGLEPGAPTRIAQVARGTPREALRLLEQVLQEAAGRGDRRIDVAAVNACLAGMGCDAQGLRPLEQRYLALLRHSLKPISLNRLAELLETPTSTVRREVEPFLFRLGLIDVGPHGRFALRGADVVAAPELS